MLNSGQLLDPDRLLELLGKQRDAYQKLSQLAQQQRTLITDQNPERLLTVLRERQTIVGQLARFNIELAPYRQTANGAYSEFPESIRAQANGLLNEINQMLQKILKSDREDGALLSARKAAVADELQTVSGGQAANAAYAANSINPTHSNTQLNG
jgi:hypothetical protein